MKNHNKSSSSPRSYPPFWEKFVPIAIGIIIVFIIILITIAVTVVLGIFPIN